MFLVGEGEIAAFHQAPIRRRDLQSLLFHQPKPQSGRGPPSPFLFASSSDDPSIRPLLLDSIKGKESPCLTPAGLLGIAQFSHACALEKIFFC
jgi:hypothetical protein